MNIEGASSPQSDSRRTYHSPLRTEQAHRTRSRIVQAAVGLFLERGYGATTLKAIAELAGVSTVLVQQNGPKSALLLAAVEQLSTGSEGFDSIDELPAVADLQQQIHGSHDVLRVTAQFAGESNRRVSRLWLALDRAADDDPQVAQHITALIGRMRADARKAINAIAGFGGLRTDRTPDELADVYWSLGLPDLYHRLVEQAGWTHAAYVAWLEQTLTEQLLARATQT